MSYYAASHNEKFPKDVAALKEAVRASPLFVEFPSLQLANHAQAQDFELYDCGVCTQSMVPAELIEGRQSLVFRAMAWYNDMA